MCLWLTSMKIHQNFLPSVYDKAAVSPNFIFRKSLFPGMKSRTKLSWTFGCFWRLHEININNRKRLIALHFTWHIAGSYSCTKQTIKLESNQLLNLMSDCLFLCFSLVMSHLQFESRLITFYICKEKTLVGLAPWRRHVFHKCVSRLSNTIWFMAKNDCHSKKITNQTRESLLLVVFIFPVWKVVKTFLVAFKRLPEKGLPDMSDPNGWLKMEKIMELEMSKCWPSCIFTLKFKQKPAENIVCWTKAHVLLIFVC